MKAEEELKKDLKKAFEELKKSLDWSEEFKDVLEDLDGEAEGIEETTVEDVIYSLRLGKYIGFIQAKKQERERFEKMIDEKLHKVSQMFDEAIEKGQCNANVGDWIMKDLEQLKEKEKEE